jgi:hypothetical protein
LGGLPIGKGAWVIDITEDHFTAAASGGTAGLLQMFSRGQGTGAARGLLVSGAPAGSTFSANIISDRKTEEIRMTIVGHNARDVAVTPPQTPSPDRIPLTAAHRHGVLDPMSSVLFHVPGRGNLLTPEACPAHVPVFDGRIRFDLRLAYKRIEHVKAERGYDGPSVVCSIHFFPIAGYVPTRFAIKYLTAQREMEAWLVPIAGTRIVVPFRVSVPTPVGVGVLQATQFVTSAQTARAKSTIQ